MALGCWLLVSLAIAFLVGKGMSLAEQTWLFSPLWLPFLVILASVFLMRPERGLAVATGLGTVELCLAIIAFTKPMGLHEQLAVAGTILLTGGLVVAAVKANSALAPMGGSGLWKRALGWGGGFLVLQVAAVVIVAVMPSPGRRPHLSPRESMVVETLHTINTAASSYYSRYQNGYPASLEVLGPSQQGPEENCNAAGLLDSGTFSMGRTGYVFTYSPGPPVRTPPLGCLPGVQRYTLGARPAAYGKTGMYSFFTADSGAIYFTAENRAATKEDSRLMGGEGK